MRHGRLLTRAPGGQRPRQFRGPQKACELFSWALGKHGSVPKSLTSGLSGRRTAEIHATMGETQGHRRPRRGRQHASGAFLVRQVLGGHAPNEAVHVEPRHADVGIPQSQ